MSARRTAGRKAEALATVAIVAAAAAMVAVQAAYGSVIIGSDTTFHFSRVYDTYMQLRTGDISWFQTNFGFQQSGRVVNALYGPLFAYLMGAVLLVAGTWLRFQLAMAFLAYVVAGLGMYALARRTQRASLASRQPGDAGGADAEDSPALLAIACGVAVAYMNLGWVARWQTSTNMTAWGAVIAPYLGLVCLRMVCPHREEGRPAQARVSALTLALVVSATAQVHLLSCAMFLVALVPFWVTGMVRANDVGERRRMLLSTLAAVLIAVVLTGDVWAGLLEVMLNNHMASPVAMALEDGALSPSWELEGKANVHWAVLALLVASLVWAAVRRDRAALPLGAVGAAFMLLASSLVPWARIGAAVPALEHTFQFPVRLMVVAYPLLFACLADMLGWLAGAGTGSREPRAGAAEAGAEATDHLHGGMLAPGAAALLACAALVANGAMVAKASQTFYERLTSSTHVIRLTDASDEEVRKACLSDDPGDFTRYLAKRTPDYLPNHDAKSAKGLSAMYEKDVLGALASGAWHHEVLSDGSLRITWDSGEDANVSVPVITYAQSELSLEGTTLVGFETNRIGMPTIRAHEGTNTLLVRFVASPATYVVIGVSLASWAVLPLGAIIVSVERSTRVRKRTVQR